MKKFKLIIDASDWKVFGFDALCNKDFYASLASQEIISGAFHEKYDKTINSAASIKRLDNAKQYINEQFNDFFGKPEATEIKWSDMLIKSIRQYISIHYVTRYLKPYFKKMLDLIDNVQLTDLVISRAGLGLFELTFTIDEEAANDNSIDEESLTDFIEGVVGSFDNPVTDGLVVDPEKFESICAGLQQILVNEMVKNLNPSFTKFVKGFLKG